MIIGNGDIASALRDIDRDDRIYFASGVSNSAETRASEFRREMTLLADVTYRNRGMHLVYVSSLSVFYSNTPYADHKRTMEYLVKKRAQLHTIVRVGNIDFGSNPHTIINFLRSQLQRGEAMTIQDTYRYIVSKDELLHWLRLIPSWSCEMNIPGERLTVQQIVDRYALSTVEVAV